MDGQEVALRAMFREQVCHRCGHRYQPETLLLLERRSDVCVAIVPCLVCQQSDTYILHFTYMSGDLRRPNRVTGYRLGTYAATPEFSEVPETPMPSALSPLDIPETPRPGLPVTSSDVQEIQRFLQNFDGNFHNLFTYQDDE